MKKGFTLIEIMVALSVFVLVMTISMGSILGVFSANAKSQSIKVAMDNLNSALETMSREMRFGTEYQCGSGAITCPGGESSVSFKNQTGQQITYSLGGTNGKTLMKAIDGGSAIAVTSKEISLSTLAFYVLGASDGSQQPRVFIRLKGLAGFDPNTQTSFALQTLVSQRVLNSLISP
jgi:prepilin-type N-terminal cleavage/methylation domain-containing protein